MTEDQLWSPGEGAQARYGGNWYQLKNTLDWDDLLTRFSLLHFSPFSPALATFLWHLLKRNIFPLNSDGWCTENYSTGSFLCVTQEKGKRASCWLWLQLQGHESLPFLPSLPSHGHTSTLPPRQRSTASVDLAPNRQHAGGILLVYHINGSPIKGWIFMQWHLTVGLCTRIFSELRNS